MSRPLSSRSRKKTEEEEEEEELSGTAAAMLYSRSESLRSGVTSGASVGGGRVGPTLGQLSGIMQPVTHALLSTACVCHMKCVLCQIYKTTIERDILRSGTSKEPRLQ